MVVPTVKFLVVTKLAFELGRSIRCRNTGGYIVLDCYHMHLDNCRYLEESGE